MPALQLAAHQTTDVAQLHPSYFVGHAGVGLLFSENLDPVRENLREVGREILALQPRPKAIIGAVYNSDSPVTRRHASLSDGHSARSQSSLAISKQARSMARASSRSTSTASRPSGTTTSTTFTTRIPLCTSTSGRTRTRRSLGPRSGATSKRPASRPSASSAASTTACKRHILSNVNTECKRVLTGSRPSALAGGCPSRSCSQTRRL